MRPQNKLWVAAVTTRNERDFIEAFIEANSKFIDHFIIFDDSDDGTFALLERMSKMFSYITLIARAPLGLNQVQSINRGLEIAVEMGATAFFPIDADEILMIDLAEVSLEQIDKRIRVKPLELELVAFVPTFCDAKAPSPLSEAFHSVELVPRRLHSGVTKIALWPGLLSEGAEISPGNHAVLSQKGKPMDSWKSPHVRLAHFPVRSEAQFISKLAQAIVTIRLKEGRSVGEALHLIPLADSLVRHDYRLSLRELQRIAARYSSPMLGPWDSIVSRPVLKQRRTLLEALLPPATYKPLVQADLVRSLLLLIQELVSQKQEYSAPSRIDPFRRFK